MKPINILVNFANAILELETATKKEDELGMTIASDDLVRCWNVYAMNGVRMIPFIIAELAKVRSESNNE